MNVQTFIYTANMTTTLYSTGHEQRTGESAGMLKPYDAELNNTNNDIWHQCVYEKKEKAIPYQVDPTTQHHHPCQNIAVRNLLSPVTSNKLLTSK